MTKNFADEHALGMFIKNMGGTLYLVGGAVRDQIMGIAPHDRDYLVVGVTKLPFPQTQGICPVYIADVDRVPCEVALARSERKTGAGYNGFTFAVTADVNTDLRRRDFTINAIAQNVATGEIVDPFGGRDDLNAQQLRVVDHTTFIEDPTRVYRAARFAAKLNFAVDSATVATIRAMRDIVATELKVEQIWRETQKALALTRADLFFEYLKAWGILDIHMPELAALDVPDRHDVSAWHHTMRLLRDNPHTPPLVKWGTLCHDLGKGLTDPAQHPHHYGHAALGIDAAINLATRLHSTKAAREFGSVCAGEHMRFKHFTDMRPVKAYRFYKAHTRWWQELRAVSIADGVDDVALIDTRVARLLATERAAIPALTDAGIKGAQFKTLLEQEIARGNT